MVAGLRFDQLRRDAYTYAGFAHTTFKYVIYVELFGDLAHVEAIIRSMTLEERNDPSILNASRRRRIAKGSGTSLPEVNRLVKQFGEMQKMMKMMRGRGGKLPSLPMGPPS